MFEIGIDSVVKYIGPAPECDHPDSHTSPIGSIGVVSDIQTRPDHHDIEVVLIWTGDVGFAMSSELQPLDDWPEGERSLAAGGDGQQPLMQDPTILKTDGE